MINPKTISTSSGDIVGYEIGKPLTDTQINALNSSNNLYNVFSVYDGDNFTEVLETNVSQKVKEMRTKYAKWLDLDKYYDSQVEEGADLITHNVTNEDMSSYV